MIKERPKFNWLHLLIFIVVVEAIGSLSAWLAGDIIRPFTMGSTCQYYHHQMASLASFGRSYMR